VDHTHEVVSTGFLIESWTIIEIVLQHCNSFVALSVYLTKQRHLLSLSLEYLDSIGTHMSRARIIGSLKELTSWQLVWRIDVSLELTGHAKIVYIKRVLVNMLEHAVATVLE
jgi:hypothetical protein